MLLNEKKIRITLILFSFTYFLYIYIYVKYPSTSDSFNNVFSIFDEMVKCWCLPGPAVGNILEMICNISVPYQKR